MLHTQMLINRENNGQNVPERAGKKLIPEGIHSLQSDRMGIKI